MTRIETINYAVDKYEMIKNEMIRAGTTGFGMNASLGSTFRRCANVLTILAASSLSACGAAVPTHYHTLLGVATDSMSPSNSTSAFLIDVQPVGIPPQVDQPQLVVRDGGQGMLVLEHERWIAPLGDELRAALSAELSRQLGTQDVAGQSRPAKASVVRIKIDLRRFDSAPGEYAALEAIWSVHKTDEKSDVVLCTSRERESIGPGYDELVRGHQRALIALADTIAVAVQHLTAGTNAGCPSG